MRLTHALFTGQDRFADIGKTITRTANPDHFAGLGKMVSDGQFLLKDAP